jgi:uncharacterized protein
MDLKRVAEHHLALLDRGFPVEVKLTASPGRETAATIDALARNGAPLGPGAVVCLTPAAFPLSRTVEALPASSID